MAYDFSQYSLYYASGGAVGQEGYNKITALGRGIADMANQVMTNPGSALAGIAAGLKNDYDQGRWQMEQGDYEGAGKTFGKLFYEAGSLVVATAGTVKVATAVGKLAVSTVAPAIAYAAAGVAGEAGALSARAAKNLGNLVGSAEKTVAEAILERGGNMSNIRQLQTGMGQKTLAEVAEAAAAGDRESVKALKMVKQADVKGQRY